ncbi:MAG: inositol monophosphatase [bacterium]|nr:inositol monophosphatase [bacterium]
MMRAIATAARGLVRDFGEVEHLQVSKKGPGDFVSAADHKAEKILQEELEKARPGYSFLMEESGVVPGKDKDHTWIIDPLDGTNNFLHGLPHFAITVALQKKKEIVAAVTYDPLRDEMFYAEKGFGTFVNQRRLRVSERRSLSDSLLATGRPYQAKSALPLATLQSVSSIVPCIRQTGSAALDLAYVAAGRLDGAWAHNLARWDIAAGILMIREAGGCISDIKGRDVTPETTDIVAANMNLHAPLLKLIA